MLRTNPDSRLTVQDLHDWESVHGPIPSGSVVLMRSGYGKYYATDRLKYFGVPPAIYQANPKDTENLHFPGFHPRAAEWLVKNRDESVKPVEEEEGENECF